MFMESTKSNGHHIEEKLAVKILHNHCSSPFVQYSKATTTTTSSIVSFDSMAPRTGSYPSPSVSQTDSPPASKSAFTLPGSPLPSSLAMDGTNSVLFSGLGPCNSGDAADKRLKSLVSRCTEAEQRIKHLLVVLGHLEAKKNHLDFSSDATVSSSDDEDSSLNTTTHSETWLRNRVVMRCHWQQLRWEMAKNHSRLARLLELRQRYRALRKMPPPVSDSPLNDADSSCSRVRPYHSAATPRMPFIDISRLRQLDYKFPGSAKPLRLNYPQCREAFASGCIACCPAFDTNAEEIPSILTSDIVEKSLNIDNPKCQTARSAETPKNLAGIQPPLPPPTMVGTRNTVSCSSSSASSSQDGGIDRKNRRNRQNGQSGDAPKARRPSYVENNSPSSFQLKRMEMPLPLWRTVPYPARNGLGNQANRPRQRRQLPHQPQISLADGRQFLEGPGNATSNRSRLYQRQQHFRSPHRT